MKAFRAHDVSRSGGEKSSWRCAACVLQEADETLMYAVTELTRRCTKLATHTSRQRTDSYRSVLKLFCCPARAYSSYVLSSICRVAHSECSFCNIRDTASECQCQPAIRLLSVTVSFPPIRMSHATLISHRPSISFVAAYSSSQ